MYSVICIKDGGIVLYTDIPLIVVTVYKIRRGVFMQKTDNDGDDDSGCHVQERHTKLTL